MTQFRIIVPTESIHDAHGPQFEAGPEPTDGDWVNGLLAGLLSPAETVQNEDGTYSRHWKYEAPERPRDMVVGDMALHLSKVGYVMSGSLAVESANSLKRLAEALKGVFETFRLMGRLLRQLQSRRQRKYAAERARIEAHTGRPLTDAWLADFRERRNQQLLQRLTPIRHAPEAVEAVHGLYGGRIACASGADLFKVKLQFEKTGLMRWFEGRIFSGHDLPRSKPFPDVYLAAAAALGADPRRCAVVEDTVTGVTAGVAAGATVFGYSPPELGHGGPDALRAAGAREIFTDMAQLPRLLA